MIIPVFGSENVKSQRHKVTVIRTSERRAIKKFKLENLVELLSRQVPYSATSKKLNRLVKVTRWKYHRNFVLLIHLTDLKVKRQRCCYTLHSAIGGKVSQSAIQCDTLDNEKHTSAHWCELNLWHVFDVLDIFTKFELCATFLSESITLSSLISSLLSRCHCFCLKTH